MSKKVVTISPIITQTKKSDIRLFDGLNNLNKRISITIRKEVVANFSKFADKITEKLKEFFVLGYYIDGGYAGVLGQEIKFRSPVDEFQYRQSQVETYLWSQFSTRTADPLNPDGSAFVNGQLIRPQQAAANSGAGEVFYVNSYVEKETGAVICNTSYRDESSGIETPTNDGILLVVALCNRAL